MPPDFGNGPPRRAEQVNIPAVPQVVIPAAAFADPPKKAEAQLPKAAAGAKEDSLPVALPGFADKDNSEAGKPAARAWETFRTSVKFARNPQEAARIAAAERKLTFVLHVSGNFEESKFT
jgi:hypothetical protein